MRVAQGGINFSGGQRQRLAIARAVIRRPAIYLFDDAFSALDVHTDARVRAALRDRGRQVDGDHCGATYFDGHAQADQIVVLDGGRVVGVGHPRDTARRTARPTPSSSTRSRWAPGSGAP